MNQSAGEIDRALDLYREALQNDLGLYMAHVQMANIYEKDRRYAEAIEERRRAVDANPDDPSLLTDLGVTMGKAGKFAEAGEVLRQAMAGNPRDARVLFWLGLSEGEAGKQEEAKAALTQFVHVAPSRWEKQIGIANARLARLQ
jgi:tetratricopeptide (TPR) repeat protein